MQNEQHHHFRTSSSDLFSSINPIISLKLAEPLLPLTIKHSNTMDSGQSGALHLSKSLPHKKPSHLDENSNSSSSSSSLSSISNETNYQQDQETPNPSLHNHRYYHNIAYSLTDNLSHHTHHRVKHKHPLYAQTSPQKPNQQDKLINRKCICKNENEKLFNCLECTRNYPVSVRRSRDDEDTKNYLIKDVSMSASIKLSLKPSPIPTSSTLIDLLALTKPSNTFITPPNINIAHFIKQQSKK